MTKYHLSANGPRICKAVKQGCPLGADSPHFESQVEAQAAYEAKMNEAFGVLSTVNKSSSEKTRQASYKARDNSIKFAKRIVNSAPVIASLNLALAIQDAPARTHSLAVSKIRQLTNFAKRLRTKVNNSFVEMKKRRDDSKIELINQMNKIFIAAQANRININDEKARNRAKEMRRSTHGAIFGVKSAKNLKLGSKLANGNTIISLHQAPEGKMVIHSVNSNGSYSLLTVNPNAKFDIETPQRRALRSIQSFGISERLKTAGKLQKEVFQSMFSTHYKTAQKVSQAQGATQFAIHNKKQDFALFS